MNKKLNDVAPSEWDRAARSNISHDMKTEKGRQAAWEQFAEVGLEAWATPAEEEAAEISLDGCTTELDWDEDEEEELDRYDNGYALKVSKEDVDAVNNPDHYNTGNIECIEAIEESMSSVAFKGYLKGNCMKYLWRYDYKGKQVEDLQKTGWYLNKLTEIVIEENT